MRYDSLFQEELFGNTTAYPVQVYGSSTTLVQLLGQYVQKMVTDKAHRLGIRISRICAWGTSKLAFDGSGTVKRGKASKKTTGNYSICEFQSGKA